VVHSPFYPDPRGFQTSCEDERGGRVLEEKSMEESSIPEDSEQLCGTKRERRGAAQKHLTLLCYDICLILN